MRTKKSLPARFEFRLERHTLAKLRRIARDRNVTTAEVLRMMIERFDSGPETQK